MLLEGLQLPLTTPFYSDGRLNLPKLEHNAARYSKTPVAGLVALSDSGEPTMLSEEETRQVLRSVAEAAAPEKVLMAGGSRDSVVGTLDLSETAAEFGYDAVLVKRASIFAAGWGACECKGPLSGFSVGAALTGRMETRNGGNTEGLIAADTLTGGGAALVVAPTKAVTKTRTKMVGFQMLAGDTAGILECLRAGAVGAMPAFAASAPQAC